MSDPETTEAPEPETTEAPEPETPEVPQPDAPEDPGAAPQEINVDVTTEVVPGGPSE